MVCPNCHSDEVIQVQDQHFCISCGQMVPETAATPVGAGAASTKRAAKVQPNGLPEGVTILPLAPVKDHAPAAAKPVKTPAPVAAVAADQVGEPAAAPLIIKRSRLPLNPDEEPADPAAAKPAEASPALASTHVAAPIAPITAKPVKKSAKVVKPSAKSAAKRKPGRPKAGRLDVVRPVASTVGAVVKPASVRSPLPAVTAPLATGRSMNDIAPRRPADAAATQPVRDAAADQVVTAPPIAGASKPAAKAPKAVKPAKLRGHRLGVPPLHYGPVIAFALRSRAQAHHAFLAGFGALALGAAGAWGAWAALHGGLTAVTDGLIHAGPKLLAEAGLLAIIYYVGRSLGQSAIMYGIVREADQRPVTLSRQIGVGINTFGRRLSLDLGFAIVELLMLGAAAVLVLTGGRSWPVPAEVQVALLFLAYLVILYVLTALAMSRGLAGVALTLTNLRPATTAKLGWQLFSHRFELIGPRLGALLMEAILAVPLIVLAVGLISSAPAKYGLWVIIGVGLLAWLAGALFGVGTAAWWAMLYRQLVLADRPAAAVALLSSRHPEEARRAPLSGIVALVTLLIAATLILPWLAV